VPISTKNRDSLGYYCASLIPLKTGNVFKTDRLDALKLAEFYARNS
jgi:hypothetical protein